MVRNVRSAGWGSWGGGPHANMQLTTFPQATGAVHIVGDDPQDAVHIGIFFDGHKWIAHQEFRYPYTVVLTDQTVHLGIPQLVPEFLFLGFLFKEGNVDLTSGTVKRRIRFVGTRDQLSRI